MHDFNPIECQYFIYFLSDFRVGWLNFKIRGLPFAGFFLFSFPFFFFIYFFPNVGTYKGRERETSTFSGAMR